MKKLFALSSLLLSLTLFACTPRMAGHLIGGAIVGAAVVGTAAAASHHFHHHNCGCHRHWDGHWVYYYQGGYEYYDPQARVWYRY